MSTYQDWMTSFTDIFFFLLFQLMNFHKHGVDWNEELDSWDYHVTKRKSPLSDHLKHQTGFPSPAEIMLSTSSAGSKLRAII